MTLTMYMYPEFTNSVVSHSPLHSLAVLKRY